MSAEIIIPPPAFEAGDEVTLSCYGFVGCRAEVVSPYPYGYMGDSSVSVWVVLAEGYGEMAVREKDMEALT